MHISHIAGLLGMTVLFGAITANAEPLPPMEGRTNLALGQKVLFSPPPNYSLTAKGGTDAMDLTDGKLSTRPDQMLWFESSSVGWTYPGRFNLAVDLGKPCDINEIAIRLQNGSPFSGGRMFPGWVEAFVSNDGVHYQKVGEFSQWNKDDFLKFNIGQGMGKSWVDCLRFKDLKAHGRWVGLRMYGNGTTVSDELYVFGSPSSEAVKVASETTDASFTVTHPQVYFHKPFLELATNLALPVPLGLNLPEAAGSDVNVKIDLPPGIDIASGSVSSTKISDLFPEQLSDGWKRYSFSVKNAKSDKVFGQLYLQATGLKDGQSSELRYQFGDDNWESAPVNIPVRAVNVPAAPRLKTIMASMGWWNSPAVDWPQELQAFRVLGLNTFPVFGMWMPKDEKDPQWAKLEEARKQGFFISNIDDAVGNILKHKDAPEIYDQFEDGTVGTHLCISYRGKYYQEEIQRFAQMMAKIHPDFTSEDIEVWGWAGPTDSMKCTRCLEDFKQSGAGSWAEWQQGKGKEMIHDEIVAAQKAVKETDGKPFVTGLYDVRPGQVYQQIFDYNSLYPELLNNSQPSTYTSLQAADIEWIGDEARKDRSQLPRSDVQPWLSPGDAGVFPGDSFQWATLECYANGSNGIWFWSSRMWDSEDLIAYNKVIRAIAPMEDVIVKGDLVGSSATIAGEGRVSGMKLGNRMMLLAADYFGKSDGFLKINLTLPIKSQLRDLLSGETVGKVLSAGKQTVTLPLNGQRARLLEVVPQK
jgi:hypothetical protein